MEAQHIQQLLRREVVPAIGCTEPVAVALCVARAREILGCLPEQITVRMSPNIYKNAMAVGIPMTGMTGLPIAIALGALIGRSEWGLEVLKETSPEAVERAKAYLKRVPAQLVVEKEAPDVLYIRVEVAANGHRAEATIQGEHTHFLEPDNPGNSSNSRQSRQSSPSTPSSLTMHEVYDFALSAPLSDLRFLLDGARLNKQAAEQSFRGNYGHSLGRLLQSGQMASVFGDTLFTKILAYTSGACDARMAGAMVPVMSNSGSGNQGISCSVPVLLYAEEHQSSEPDLIRALALSNLTEIYIKQSLGRLSALCGCVVASTGSAVGITYLMGGRYPEITYAIKNMIANISGMICDGAKPGCSLKVTSGVATAVLSASLAMQHSYAASDEGIVEEDIDRTIHNLTRIGHEGMQETDRLILDIMTSKGN